MEPNSGADSSGRNAAQSTHQQDRSAPSESNPSGQDGLLEQILSATSDEKSTTLSASTTRELTEVARELNAEPFCLDPVLIRLVRVFSSQLKGLSAARSAQLERSVAGSLYDDVSSRERAEKLWEHLKKLASDEK